MLRFCRGYIVTAAQKQTCCNLHIGFYCTRETEFWNKFCVTFLKSWRCSNVSSLGVCTHKIHLRWNNRSLKLIKKQICSRLFYESSYLWIKKFRLMLCAATFAVYKPQRKMIVLHSQKCVCILKEIDSSFLHFFIFSFFFPSLLLPLSYSLSCFSLPCFSFSKEVTVTGRSTASLCDNDYHC